ncbi:MAG: transglutaminase family protein [Candidatus Delongbacteria bacterium]|nr:transglutaminase family protein [Candidatus Delongbacteria bacterium]
MKKKILLLSILLFTFPKFSFAQENYEVNANIEYKALENGTTAVTHTITLKNKTTYEYAKNYVFELSNIEPYNIKAYESGSPIPLQINKEGDKFLLTLNFPEPLVGKDKSRTFIVTYEENHLSKLSGEVWEISIPKILSKYNNGKIILSIPDSFGEEAIVSPNNFEKEEENNRRIYSFEKSNIEKSGINAVFGKFQVYSIKLIYHLENNKDTKDTLSIAVPPDTSTQKMYYSDINPRPINIEVDDDGNWIAKFEILPKRKQDITVTGYAQVFSNPVKILNPNPSTTLENLKEQEFWEVNDPKIKEIAKSLKTPEKIYDFVVQVLTYNSERVKPNVERLGALKALSSANNAICTEFTDLFITLSRAAGIPAREINGYAYSDNPDLQPISLISDVLHSWPEYWNENEQNWIPVDPTWESTSKIDYFSKFDLKHIAFVIHGKSSTKPLSAGSYKTDNLSKDVFVEYSQLPIFSKQPVVITCRPKHTLNPFRKRIEISFINNQESAMYKLTPKIEYSEKSLSPETIQVLPPFSSYTTTIDIPLGILAIDTPDEIKISIDNVEEKFYLSKAVYSIQQLVIFLSILIFTLIVIFYKTKNEKVKAYLKNVVNKISNVKRSKKN